MPAQSTDRRRAVAERNVEAILDAAERLLSERGTAGISAVASEAGVSRVTVYAHFDNSDALVKAVMERAVRRVGDELEELDLDSGPAMEALERLVTAGWRELERHHSVARATGKQLAPEERRRGHEPVLDRVRALIARGRAEGSFRTDLAEEWLVAGFYSLLHAAADEVRAGRMEAGAALDALVTTLRELFAGIPSAR